MQRRTVLIGGLGAAAAARSAGAQDADSAEGGVEGVWGGVLPVGGPGLRLKLEVARGDGGVTATLYSLDQGGAPIAAETAKIDAGRLTARYPSIRAALDLRLTGPDTLQGTFTQGRPIDLSLTRNPDFDALAVAAPPALTAESLDELRARAGSPALAAAARGPGGAPAFAVGVRQAGEKAEVTTDDIWHLGSITKWMTATLVARAVDAGDVTWDTRVGDVFGGDVPEMRNAYRDVTLRHLLCHRAGLPANPPTLTLMAYPVLEDDPRETRLDHARTVLTMEPVGPKEETFLYSNSGFILAGTILETRLGAPWEQIIRERLFDPLGMSTAGFGAPGTPGALDQPVGHTKGLFANLGLGRRRAPHPPGAGRADNPAVLGPAGRVHMSLADLLTFLEAQRDRTDLVSAAGWDAIQTPPFGGDYALGNVVRSEGTGWHNGSNTMWYAEAMFDRARGVVAASAANDGALGHSQPATAAALASAAATASA